MAPTAGTRLRMQKAQAKKQQRGPAKKVPSLKNRIRAIERFLKRGEIPDATRRAKKAELAQLQQEHQEKERVEQEKANAEKYKKPRFFERVKIMRKLRQAKRQMESAADDAEAQRHKADYERYREDMMYIYFYPRSEPYLSLLPSKPHSDEELQRQKQLRKDAIARFEKEQPVEAFHQFCFNDGKSADQQPSTAAAAASLLIKRPSKEEAKKHKKLRKKHDKVAAPAEPVLADMEEADLEVASKEKKEKKEKKKKKKKEKEKEAEQEEEEEEDDFFL